MSIKNKINASSLISKAKPDTITRAGITANLKFTRGKQLVEHDPFTLIPDPQNPRPGELIDDIWLKENLKIGTEHSLCKLNSDSGEYLIPKYSEIPHLENEALEDSYNFLRDLAYSIRHDGLIEPIEIFLADRDNDPDYFVQSNIEYGYVILEGHQRRLAAMMAGVPRVTCIEITDESMLAKLKVKHRKLRRQLSENNLRKGLSVSQNFQIVQKLLSDSSTTALSNSELSSIIGLNEGIASALRSMCNKPDNYPPIFLSKIIENKLTFKAIRSLVPKSYEEIQTALEENNKEPKLPPNKIVKARGRQGGAIKRSATFKISSEKESLSLQKFLLSRFPEINEEHSVWNFKSLESILLKIKDLALTKV